MRRELPTKMPYALLGAILVVFLLTACASSGSQTTSQTGVSAPTATSGSSSQPTAKQGKASPTVKASNSSSDIGDAISAAKGLALAEEKAKSINADYKLYEAMGCAGTGTGEGTFNREGNIISGGCTKWRYEYVRDYTPGKTQGYHDLYVWVSSKGVSTEEKEWPKAVVKRPKGVVADWIIDSTQAMQIAEQNGGADFRKAYPNWDPANNSAKLGTIHAMTKFTPYFDMLVNKGKDVPGSKGVVWEITYPMDKLVFVIDATTGQILLKYDAPDKGVLTTN